MNAQEYAEAVKKKFGKIVQAISTGELQTFLAVPRFADEDEQVILSLWATDMKDFYVPVTDIEGQDTDRWIVKSPRQDWVLQKPPVEEIAKRYAKQMREAGFDA